MQRSQVFSLYLGLFDSAEDRSIETSLVRFSVPICQLSFPQQKIAEILGPVERGRLLSDPEGSGSLDRSGLFQGEKAKKTKKHRDDQHQVDFPQELGKNRCCSESSVSGRL